MPKQNITVTIENLAPENGTFITPLWVGFHDGEFDTYDLDKAVSPGLESLAEDGATETISTEFLASDNGAIDGALIGLEDTEGPIDPGEIVSQTFTVDSDAPDSRYFNYASMVLPSNDAFIANDDPLAYEIFDAEGNFAGADFIVAGDEVLDAGTEINDEAADSTAFFDQAAPNTGESEGGVAEVHPGFDPKGRILSSSEFADADFTTDGYDLARITVTAEDIPTITKVETQDEDPLTPATEGNDFLIGNDGFDRLNGKGGDDLLDGGNGVTVYSGGTGSDSFIVHNDALVDRVKDFELGVDRIILADGLTFKELQITGGANSNISFEGEKVAFLADVNPDDLDMTSFQEF